MRPSTASIGRKIRSLAWRAGASSDCRACGERERLSARLVRQKMQAGEPRTTRRQLLTAIGMMGGTAALYQAMTTMGHAAETQFKGPPDLSGGHGATVLVLGAGLAGMLAAYELNKAGYKVRVL